MKLFPHGKGRQTSFARNPRFLVYAAGLLLALVPMALIVDGNEVPSAELSVFRSINDLPDILYNPLWPFMQLGNLIFVPVVALVALLLRHFRLAFALLAVGAAKLLLEDVVKSWVFRERPGSVVEEVALRGDTPSAGQAFVSGHAVLAVGIATLLFPYLGRRWRVVVCTLAALVCFGRVYSGAHFPLDVIGGGFLGAAIGCVLNFSFETPQRESK